MANNIKQTKFISSSPEETKKIAGEVLARALKQKREGALVIGLKGELGAGKTQFTQGAAKHMGIKRNITSPTFVLMKRYGNFYHFDCYRTRSSEEIKELEWESIIAEPKNIVIVEWAEKIKDIMPEDTLWLKFKNKGEDRREILTEG